jgi:hypothetical protein
MGECTAHNFRLTSATTHKLLGVSLNLIDRFQDNVPAGIVLVESASVIATQHGMGLGFGLLGELYEPASFTHTTNLSFGAWICLPRRQVEHGPAGQARAALPYP